MLQSQLLVAGSPSVAGRPRPPLRLWALPPVGAVVASAQVAQLLMVAAVSGSVSEDFLLRAAVLLEKRGAE